MASSQITRAGDRGVQLTEEMIKEINTMMNGAPDDVTEFGPWSTDTAAIAKAVVKRLQGAGFNAHYEEREMLPGGPWNYFVYWSQPTCVIL